MLTPRPYQRAANERVYDHWEAGRHNVILCLPTGGGKTVSAACVVDREIREGHPGLYLAHRRELVQQPFATLIRAGLSPEQIGVIMAGVSLPESVAAGGRRSLLPAKPLEEQTSYDLWANHARRRPTAPIQLASVDTLRNRQIPYCDWLIIDEAHRTLAKSYLTIIAELVQRNPKLRLLGLTATPERSDKRGLDEVYNEIVIGATYAELVAMTPAALVQPKLFAGKNLPDLGAVQVNGNDYDAKQLAEACDREGLIGDIVEHYQTHGNGAPALAFATSVEHSKRIVARFLAAGIPAAHVDGETHPTERDRIFRELQAGSIRVVANCDVATEGTDLPAVKTIILARPTKSLRVYLQQVGRGSRPHKNGFPFVVLDHAGCALEHGHPAAERPWSLEALPRNARKRTGPPLRTCDGCYAIIPAALKTCPECGKEHVVIASGPPEESDGQLVEVLPPDSDAEIAAVWSEIVAAWTAANATKLVPEKPEWCKLEYGKRFGVNRPKWCELPTLTPEERFIRDGYLKFNRQAQAAGYSRSWVFQQVKKLRAEIAADPSIVGAAADDGALERWAV